MDTDCWDRFTFSPSISIDRDSRQSEEGEGGKRMEIHIDCSNSSGVHSCVTWLSENIYTSEWQMFWIE